MIDQPTNAMSDQPANQDDWQPCPAGQIRGMIRRLRSERRQRAFRRVAAPAAIVLVVVFAGFYAAESQPGGRLFRPGGLTCSDVQEHLPAYAAGKTTPELSRKLEEHLAHCAHCREMRDARGERVTAPVFPVRRNQQPQELAFATPRR